MTDSWAALVDLPGVAAAAAAAEAAAGAVYRLPVNLRGWPRTAAAAAVRAARSSAAIDGGTALDLAGLVDSDDGTVRDPHLAGALRVADALAGLVPLWRRAPLQVLARLHVLAAADLAPADELGRPRPTAAARVGAVAQVVIAGPWPGSVRAAVVLAELLTAEPFPVGNGIVARAAARLTGMTCALDPRGLLVPEVELHRHRDRAAVLLRAYASGEAEAVAAWLQFGCAAWEAGAREARGIAAAQ